VREHESVTRGTNEPDKDTETLQALGRPVITGVNLDYERAPPKHEARALPDRTIWIEPSSTIGNITRYVIMFGNRAQARMTGEVECKIHFIKP